MEHSEAALKGLEQITCANQINSPLLRLPAELRNNIYRQIFYGSSVRVYQRSRSRRDRCNRKRKCRFEHARDIVSVLQTCRRIYFEAYHLYLSTATFNILDAFIEYFVRDFDHKKLGLVTSIECSAIEQHLWDNKGGRRSPLGFLGGLKRVHVKTMTCLGQGLDVDMMQATLKKVTGGRVFMDEIEITASEHEFIEK